MSSAPTESALLDALKTLVDPHTGKDYVSTKSLKNLRIDGADVAFGIELGYPAKSQHAALRKACIAAARSVPGVANVSVEITTRIASHAVQRGVQLLPKVKNIIAVASGKGGVGKSTTTVNLALALAAEGASVGILDADIYGPSQPMMMGLSGRPESEDGKTIEPLENYGVQVMSIGFLIEPDQAMIWRGPMATQALDQLLNQTNWRELDYLLVDMPPGTGDIALTLSQRVPLTGAVIVTTPQDIALLDARKGLKMFEKVGVPILGIVENMAVYSCPNCGHTEHIFGADGGRRMAAEYGVDYLGALPLTMAIREQADSGRPTVVADPEGDTAALYKAVARQVAVKIALKAKDFSAKFPSITVSKGT
jgi:ATP-binding protein involved in chromosome partitioning